jgi:hypothetical protein
MTMESEEIRDPDPEAYHTIMEYLKKVNARIDTLTIELEEIKESVKKPAEDPQKGEIMGYCEECKHPLTSTEIEEESVCPYCQKSTKCTKDKPSEGLGLFGLF